MVHQYLDEDGYLPDDLDWDAEISIVEDRDSSDETSQLVIRNLIWETALYYNGPDFQDTIENGYSDVYHEKLDGVFLVGYRFNHPEIDLAGNLTIRGYLHPGVENVSGDYHTDESVILQSATLTVKFKDSRTCQAVREFLEA